MNEFGLIADLVLSQTVTRDDVLCGIGDDAAIIEPDLAIACDTCNEGVHFQADWGPHAIGHRALAVNLSDLAAMGAKPTHALLALSLPELDTDWLSDFKKSFFKLASAYNVELVGGDTTRGAMSMTVTVIGRVLKPLLRRGARVGDAIYVTGELGAARLAYEASKGRLAPQTEILRRVMHTWHYPTPRVNEALAFAPYVHAAIDLSDGLVADLDHIARQSGVGAVIDIDKVPVAEALKQTVAGDEACRLAMSGGDDYELCFTVSPAYHNDLLALAEQCACPLTRIGEINAGSGVSFERAGEAIDLEIKGYDHFARS